MEQHHRKLINKRMSELVSVTFDLKAIVDILFERVVINKWMKDYILGNEGESSKTTKLYEVIQGRGPDAFTDICEVLKETNNIKAYDILTSKTCEKEEDQLSPLDKEFNKIILNHDDSYVKVHPELKIMEKYEAKLNTDFKVYPMESNPKGHALVLNINNIKYRDERKGSAVDMANLMKLFQGLGYIVHPKVDLTEKQFKNVINEFINICEKEKANSIVVFIMSHGEAGKESTRSSNILAADGKLINTDWIIEQFVFNYIQHVPKLFFIQACRGKNSDFGWKYHDGENNHLHDDSTTLSPNTTIERRYEDVFVAYATIPGHTAKRDPIEGSWFVQNLCEVIRKNAYNTELNAMMLMVDKEIENLNSIHHGFQTVEWSFRGFNKWFFFNPGVYQDNSKPDTVMTTSTKPPTDV
ncbi:caspase-3-like [Metopolophium dirhodum]|uniref:caspase-3-like n=1 Tax=Metopolophium dirhodum TaxID=44670 RepID=UPI00299066F0|nr:caspase-3-like [Metopolophium dirhodum]XP_060862116.1 caspase-3-like [Metopolophium dirhodum]